MTIADGYWVIIIGQGGWVRYIGEFGLMTLPMLFLFLRRRDLNISRETAVLSMLLAGNMIDLIPNSGQTPITWLIAGALWGRLELGRYTTTDVRDDNDDDPTSPPDGPNSKDPKPVYARDFGAPSPARKPARSARGTQRRPQVSPRSAGYRA